MYFQILDNGYVAVAYNKNYLVFTKYFLSTFFIKKPSKTCHVGGLCILHWYLSVVLNIP